MHAAVGTKSYAEFSARLHQQVSAKRIPANGTIEVTHRCPLRCAHCYNNRPIADLEAQRRELMYAEHCRILDELAEEGCLWLLYSGGEPFARKDFLDIYTYAKQKGFLITLFTNGTLITPAVARHLADWRPFSIEITIYGSTAGTYERLTGVPGSYERCIRGIHLLLEQKLPVALKTVAVSINRHEIDGMKQFAGSLGVPFKFDAMMNPRIDCSQRPLAVRLKPQEIVELDVADPKRVSEWKKFAAKFNGVPGEEERSRIYDCGAGIGSFAIDPEGRMSLCVLARREMYDLRRGSFRDGWESFLRQARSARVSRATKCTECAIKPMCGMCPANAELENGCPEAPVDFLCEVAHLRARAMGILVPPHGGCEYCEV